MASERLYHGPDLKSGREALSGAPELCVCHLSPSTCQQAAFCQGALICVSLETSVAVVWSL